MTEAPAAPSWPIDTVPSRRYPVYTRMNANDVLPDPITPLGQTLAWVPAILPGWAAGYVANDSYNPTELAGEDVPPVAGFFYGYLYVNMTMVRIIGVRQGVGTQILDELYFGGRPDAPVHVSQPTDVNESLTERMVARGQWALTTTTFPDIEEERSWAERCRAQRPDLATMTPAALVAHARALMPIERFTWRGEVVGANNSAIGPAVLAQLLGGDQALVLQVIGHAGDVDSAAPSYALWDLSRLVRADGALDAEFDNGVDGLMGRISQAYPSFATALAGFLRDFGYRGPGEWDLGSDSWETRPELVLSLVDRLRQLGDGESPASRQAHQAQETEQAMAKALAIVGDDVEAQQTLHLAVASARRFGAWRERGKTNCVKVLHEARVALFELANRLHAAGHLESPRQLFMALEAELDILVADPGAMREPLRKREAEWQALFGLELPVFVDGSQPMVALADVPRRTETQVETAAVGDVLRGAGASAGIARGRVRVIDDSSALADFEPGEILVAPQTDPSWTPLFVVAAGVVVDVGAMASHAMIVSRELGIPCAAGVEAATRKLPTGTLVEVDGAAGTVTVLEL